MAKRDKKTRGSFGRAYSIVEKKCEGRDYTDDEIRALSWHVRHFYLDAENYPNAFNLRIAKKFDSEEMGQYFEQAGAYRRKGLYESTVYTRGGEFYFGYHHD